MKQVAQGISAVLTHPVLPSALFILSGVLILFNVEPHLSAWGLLLSSGGWSLATLMRWNARRRVSQVQVRTLPTFQIARHITVAIASIVGIVVGVVTMTLTSSAVGIVAGALVSALVGTLGTFLVHRQFPATPPTTSSGQALIAVGALSVAAILSLLTLLGFGPAT
jgi:uncharacterized membrane protein YiaA